jgi:hypothetical protein
MAYANVWSSAAPLGSIDPRQIDEEIRKVRLDFEERINTIIGLADANNGMNRDPVIDGTTVKSLYALQGQVLRSPAFVGSLSVPAPVRSSGSSTVTDAIMQGMPVPIYNYGVATTGSLVTFTPNQVSLGSIFIITPSGTAIGGTINMACATAINPSAAMAYEFYTIIRAAAGGSTTYSWDLTRFKGLTTLPTLIAASNQIIIKWLWSGLDSKAYELFRTATAVY